jgi:hypothetical protein
VRRGFDDTRVREEGLQKSSFYTHLSSMEFAMAIMFLIGVATLLGTLFPQGMDEAFYLARFGGRLFHIYDSLGLLGVLRSWWFMLLFALLLVALVFCVYARIRERAFRTEKGTAEFQTEFSIPKASEDVLLIFPVLLRSIGFRRKGIITEERRTEITAVKGLSPSITAFMLHVSAAVLLLGFVVSYLFSWGYTARAELDRACLVPSLSEETRWGRLVGLSERGETAAGRDAYLRMELLRFRRHYEAFPFLEDETPFKVPLSGMYMSEEQVFPKEGDLGLLLTGWESRLRLTRGEHIETVQVATGDSRMAFDLSVSQGPFLHIAEIEFPSVPETLSVVLPAAVLYRGVQFNLSAPLMRELWARSDTGGVGASAVRALRIAADSIGDGSGDYLRSGAHEMPDETIVLSSGESGTVVGLPVRLLRLFERSLIRVRSDPGRPLIRLGAALVVLFSLLRLYVYWYRLRIELTSRSGASSHVRLRMKASGLLSSPQRVAQKIASLLAK